MTTSQDVVVSEMGIGAGGAAMPGSGAAGLFACRSAASAGAMSMRQTYRDLAAAAARSANCTWAELEAMRAASPTRSRPGADVDELTAWMRKHPSALGKFEQIASASKGKKIVMFLDYDGTLSPIVANPDAAYMSDADEGGGARRCEALPDGDRERAVPRQGAQLRRPLRAVLRRQPRHGHPGTRLQSRVCPVPARKRVPPHDRRGVQGACGKDEVHTWSQGGEQQVLPVRPLQMCG
ncbi:unnamed protein product [Triticum turgidum subsp. durum]|uniref:Trehalose 6-phosphate phosphatase n=1 Tax=Triticum turgidum subsp. durum TaxID=4567 RepID=A0A9R1B2N3_TRITD|nr:unnamed protein product [Triticum turgidum subsp. durum]